MERLSGVGRAVWVHDYDEIQKEMRRRIWKAAQLRCQNRKAKFGEGYMLKVEPNRQYTLSVIKWIADEIRRQREEKNNDKNADEVSGKKKARRGHMTTEMEIEKRPEDSVGNCGGMKSATDMASNSGSASQRGLEACGVRPLARGASTLHHGQEGCEVGLLDA